MTDDSKAIEATVIDTGEVIAVSPVPSLQNGNTNGNTTTNHLTQLMRACRRGDTIYVTAILATFTTNNNSHNVLEVDTHGRTAMHHCAQCGQVQCARLLFEFNPTIVNVSDFDGFTPLHIAIITGAQAMVKFLLNDARANGSAADNEGHSLIHWATVVHNEEAIELLASAGADLDRRDPSDARPIHYASQARAPSPPLTPGTTSTNNSPSKNSHIHKPSLFSPSSSSPAGMLASLVKLIALNAQCNVRDRDGRTPLMWAAASGNAEACRLLVTVGKADIASVDHDGVSALHCAAAARGHMMMETLKVLVEQCNARNSVDPVDNNLCTPLFYTAATGNVQALAYLVKHGANVNHADKKNRTVAHVAASRGNVRIINELVSFSANVWTQSSRGDLPLHEAVQFGHSEELINIFLGLRPDMVNARNAEGRTCLHIAAANNNVVLCKMLIKWGARVNDIYRNPRTEVRFNHLKFLTAYDCAHALGYVHCAKTLKLQGGAPAETLLNVAATKIQRTARNWASKKTSRRESPAHTTTSSSGGTDHASASSLSVAASPTLHSPSHTIIEQLAETKKVRSDSVHSTHSNQNVIVVGTVAMFKDPEDQRWHVTAPPLASRRTSLDNDDEEKLNRLPLSIALEERRRSDALHELLAPLLTGPPTALPKLTGDEMARPKLASSQTGAEQPADKEALSATKNTKALSSSTAAVPAAGNRPNTAMDIPTATPAAASSSASTNNKPSDSREETTRRRHKSGVSSITSMTSSSGSGNRPVYELQDKKGVISNLELTGSEICKPPLYEIHSSEPKEKRENSGKAKSSSKDFLSRPCS